MKKSYKKPLVYCENCETGVVVSNSEAYKQEIQQKLEKIRKTELSDDHMVENKFELDC